MCLCSSSSLVLHVYSVRFWAISTTLLHQLHSSLFALQLNYYNILNAKTIHEIFTKLVTHMIECINDQSKTSTMSFDITVRVNFKYSFGYACS